MWRVFGLLAPGSPLPSNYTNLKYDLVYPTFMKPTSPISVASVMAVHRDYYQGRKGGVWGVGCGFARICHIGVGGDDDYWW